MRRGSYQTRFLISAAVVTGGLTLALGWSLLPPLLAYLAAINLTTFGFYAYDKQIAGGTRIRVPEAVLHTLAVLGGSPAALLAQQTLRHKSAKRSFQVAFWLIFAIQVALLAWWALPAGRLG